MNLKDEIRLLFTARTGVMQVLTDDEQRLREVLSDACRQLSGPSGRFGLYVWDMADQFRELIPGHPAFDGSPDTTPDTILPKIETSKTPGIYYLPDFHHIWSVKKTAIRKLRNLAVSLGQSRDVQRMIVISTPPDLLPEDVRHPVELKRDVPVLEMTRPDKTEMALVFRQILGDTLPSGPMGDKLVETALGLSGSAARQVAKRVFVEVSWAGKRAAGEQSLDTIHAEKRRLIRASGALDIVDSGETLASVGGLQVLREWLEVRREAFGQRAREYGLRPPAGLALIGIPGTGKSLCAKVAASVWQMPLLRLDMGAVFGGILGTSERNIREAIEISELISPCILWIDEIEKGFAGSSGDSGTAARVLGTFLTWMQEKDKPVCVLATANDVERLPPEFLRKGRFDEIFFLDLPTSEEREAILKVHLGRIGYRMLGQRFDLPQICKATEGFVGAEIEAVVKDAMFPAFMDQGRQIETTDLVKSAGQMVPLAKSRAEHITDLRQLVVRGEARNASRTAPDLQVNCEQIRGERFLEIPPNFSK
ncbi:MAG: ATP-dependent zinc metalloprotease FtsH [Planctomycetes bacterium ADurb.Bin412]|nr:MAG: ATP-dependent zinc metalloprotease FtsH [Planctomycetes bacterium ADurb.Bin412]